MKYSKIFFGILFLFITTKLSAQTLVPYLQNGLYGFATEEGEIVIEPKYDDVSFFGHNALLNDKLPIRTYPKAQEKISEFSKVVLNKNVTFINRKGQNIIPLESENLVMTNIINGHHNNINEDFRGHEHSDYIRIMKHNEWGIYNRKNQTFTGWKFNNESLIEADRDGYDCINNYFKEYKGFQNIDLWDLDGQKIKEGQSEISLEKDIFICLKDNAVSVFDYDGNLLNEQEGDYFKLSPDKSYILIRDDLKNSGVMDLKGNLIIKKKYESICKVDTLFYASNFKDKIRPIDIYDLNGKLLINDNVNGVEGIWNYNTNFSDPYDYVYVFKYEDAFVVKDYKGQVLKRSNEEISRRNFEFNDSKPDKSIAQYNSINLIDNELPDTFAHGTKVFVKNATDNLYRLCDYKLDIISEKKFNSFELINNHLLKYGFYHQIEEDCKPTKIGDTTKYGVLNHDGSFLIPFEYFEIYESKNGHLICQIKNEENTKTDIFDLNGNKILKSHEPVIFDERIRQPHMNPYSVGITQKEIGNDNFELFLISISNTNIEYSPINVDQLNSGEYYSYIEEPKWDESLNKLIFIEELIGGEQDLRLVEHHNLFLLSLNRFLYNSESSYILDQAGIILKKFDHNTSIDLDKTYKFLNFVPECKNKLILSSQGQPFLYDYENLITFKNEK